MFFKPIDGLDNSSRGFQALQPIETKTSDVWMAIEATD